jgi:hypothetical protein
MGKKAKEQSWSDWFFRWGMLLSGLVMIGASCPAVHTHYAWISHYGQAFGQRFVVDRRFSMFGATNQMTQWTSWFKYKTLVCRRAEEYLRPNAAQVALSVAGQLWASQGDKVMGLIPGMPEGAKHATPGGAILGCAAWDLCKNHALDRCYQYTTLAYGGLSFFSLIVIGSISGLVATILQVKDQNIKKKKKRERAQSNTACAGVIAFLCTCLGFGGWLGLFYMTMVSLNGTSWYPIPNPSFGIFMGSPALFIQLIAAICGFTRQNLMKKEDDKKDDEDWADGGGETWASMPSQHPGGITRS